MVLKRSAVVPIALALLAVVGMQSHAQPYPNKSIRVIVPFGAGSSTDVTGRIIGNALAVRLNESVVVDNRAGASGIAGTELAAKAPADGYTLLLGSNSTHGANVSLYEKLPYDPVKDFVPITQVSHIFYVLLTKNNFSARNVEELVAQAKAAPGRFTLATSGGISLLTGELFKYATQINLTSVPYKAPAPALTDLAGGRVDMLFQSPPTAMPQVIAGRMKAIAITSLNRSVQAPGIPTVAEQGYPGFQATAWIAYFAPRGTPKNIVSKLNTEIVAVLRDENVRAMLLKNGTADSEIVANTSEQLGEEVVKEIAKWRKLISVIGVPKL
jgi:tripartite-type tricarboxylate transporter receptor subunit TctC